MHYELPEMKMERKSSFYLQTFKQLALGRRCEWEEMLKKGEKNTCGFRDITCHDIFELDGTQLV